MTKYNPIFLHVAVYLYAHHHLMLYYQFLIKYASPYKTGLVKNLSFSYAIQIVSNHTENKAFLSKQADLQRCFIAPTQECRVIHLCLRNPQNYPPSKKEAIAELKATPHRLWSKATFWPGCWPNQGFTRLKIKSNTTYYMKLSVG